jgi:nicotinamidase/pyrazinamidase
MKRIDLFLIDAQNDFCNPKGSLFVPGADQDALRVAKLIDRLGKKITNIHFTLDSHHPVHIAHACWWVNQDNQHPSPFTLISAKDVENGTWRATKRSLQNYSLEYVKTLKKNGKYVCCIWPNHVQIGSWGHNLVPEVFESIKKWELENFKVANALTKGSNPKTENYSALLADVPDPSDSTTQLNVEFVKMIEEAEEIPFAGEALSHCVANTFRDLADNFSNSSYIKKLVLLRDCTSSVPGFEKQGEDFITDMMSRGLRVSNSVDYLA